MSVSMPCSDKVCQPGQLWTITKPYANCNLTPCFYHLLSYSPIHQILIQQVCVKWLHNNKELNASIVKHCSKHFNPTICFIILMRVLRYGAAIISIIQRGKLSID